MRSYFAILSLGTHKYSIEIPGSSCFARDASVPMFAKLHMHLLLQLVALAADTLHLQLAVQAAVLHLHLRGVDLW